MEVGLGGGCIAGGVECSKLEEKIEERTKEYKADKVKAEGERDTLQHNYDVELDRRTKLTKAEKCLRQMVEYA